MTSTDGKTIKGYMFLGNSEEIFDNFVNSPSVAADVFNLDGKDAYGSLLGDGHGAKNRPALAKP